MLHIIDEPLTSKSHYGSEENEEQPAEIGEGNCDRDQQTRSRRRCRDVEMRRCGDGEIRL
jgi:hypothetical protein